MSPLRYEFTLTSDYIVPAELARERRMTRKMSVKGVPRGFTLRKRPTLSSAKSVGSTLVKKSSTQGILNGSSSRRDMTEAPGMTSRKKSASIGELSSRQSLQPSLERQRQDTLTRREGKERAIQQESQQWLDSIERQERKEATNLEEVLSQELRQTSQKSIELAKPHIKPERETENRQVQTSNQEISFDLASGPMLPVIAQDNIKSLVLSLRSALEEAKKALNDAQ